MAAVLSIQQDAAGLVLPSAPPLQMVAEQAKWPNAPR
jgi:hypothetical protein